MLLYIIDLSFYVFAQNIGFKPILFLEHYNR